MAAAAKKAVDPKRSAAAKKAAATRKANAGAKLAKYGGKHAEKVKPKRVRKSKALPPLETNASRIRDLEANIRDRNRLIQRIRSGEYGPDTKEGRAEAIRKLKAINVRERAMIAELRRG